MTSYDLLLAIGEVDDLCVKKAKEKSRTLPALYKTIMPVAACLLLALLLLPLFNIFPLFGGVHQAPGPGEYIPEQSPVVFGIGEAVTTSRGTLTLISHAEAEKTMTFILEKTTDAPITVGVMDYQTGQVEYSLLLTVNGVAVATLPSGAGHYEITINYELFASGDEGAAASVPHIRVEGFGYFSP